MAIPEQFLDELNSRLNIVDVVSPYVPLTKKGANHWGLCPFHHEKTPSFSVSESRQIFHCFGCGKGGGITRFMMEIENLPFPDAVAKLAAQAGMSVPQEEGDGQWRERRGRVLALNKDAARFYRSMLDDPRGEAVAAYIRDKRRITPKYSARFGLGAAPDSWDSLITAMVEKGYQKSELLEAGLAVAGKNGGIYDKFRNRLMLPVIDPRGEVVGFTSRVMDNSAPKYLNTPETAIFRKRSVLYGLNYAKNTKRPNFILVEGNIDVITLHQAGFDNTVATMGTALTEEHARILGRYTKELVLCYDNDSAGQDATQRAIALLKNSNLTVRVLRLPNLTGPDGQPVKQDADDFIKNHGPSTFQSLLERGENGVEYRLGAVRSKYNLDSDEQRAGYLKEAAEVVAWLSSPVEREIYGGRVAEQAGVSREAVLREVEQLRKRSAWEERKKQERQRMAPAQTVQPKGRGLRYQNTRAARAEEGILRIVLLDGAFFRQLDDIKENDFTSSLLGRAYGLLRHRWEEGKPVTPAVFDGVFSGEELDHLMSIAQQPQPYHTAQTALADLKEIIRSELQKKTVGDGGDLESLRNTLRQRKGYGG